GRAPGRVRSAAPARRHGRTRSAERNRHRSCARKALASRLAARSLRRAKAQPARLEDAEKTGFGLDLGKKYQKAARKDCAHAAALEPRGLLSGNRHYSLR